jgi:hypothetical protein
MAHTLLNSERQPASVQSDDHQVQANLPAAKTTTHTMRNRNIKTAKLSCFLNSLRPSFTRVVRRKNIERTKRKIVIAAANKAMILKIIVHCQYRVTPAASLEDIAVETAKSSPEELATLTRADADKWGKIIKQLGITPQ